MAPLLRFILILLVLFMTSCSKTPTAGNLIDAKLRPCPQKPNCISSEAGSADNHKIEPLVFSGNPQTSWLSLQDIIASMGGKIMVADENYLWTTFRTKVFKFTDDLEFRLDRENSVIHIRSGARIGFSDLGVNRRRALQLTKMFDKLNNPQE